jgi:hypothetical protein
MAGNRRSRESTRGIASETPDSVQWLPHLRRNARIITPWASGSAVQSKSSPGSDGEAIDFTVADAIHGILSTCPWLEFGRVPVGGTDRRVAACRLAGGKSKTLVTPPEWQFATSLSAASTFVPNERIGDEMQFLRRDGTVDVYLCVSTGKEMFVGRTSKAK